MDLSELVHGLKPKNKSNSSDRDDSRETSQHAGSYHASGSSHRASGSRHGEQEPSSSNYSTPGRASRSISKARKEHHFSQFSSGSSSIGTPAEVTSSRGGSASGSSSGGVLVCDLCNRSFHSKLQFDQHNSVFHRRSKAPSKPRDAAFPCPYCGKAFTSPSKRTVHENATHMGLKPYQCKECNKSFGYKGGKYRATELTMITFYGMIQTNILSFVENNANLQI